MAKLISQKQGKRYAGQTIVFPLVGELKFSEDGTLEVPDDNAEALIEHTVDSFDFIKEGVEKDAKEGAENEGGPEGADADAVKEWTDLINKASSEELLKMASELQLGKPEKIAAFTDEKLRKEILKKVTSKTVKK